MKPVYAQQPSNDARIYYIVIIMLVLISYKKAIIQHSLSPRRSIRGGWLTGRPARQETNIYIVNVTIRNRLTGVKSSANERMIFQICFLFLPFLRSLKYTNCKWGKVTRQNFIALFVHSTFTVLSQNTIYSSYNWLSHQQQN